MMSLAAEAIQKSQEIRQQVASAIDHTQRLQQAAYDAVNENVIKKIAQTVTLAVCFYFVCVRLFCVFSFNNECDVVGSSWNQFWRD